jgi:hypothetical protein
VLDAVEVARPVRVDEPANELIWMSVDDALLPWLEGDAPLVLAARAVLREQARPVLPVGRDVQSARMQARLERGAAPANLLDGERDPPGDVEVEQIARDAQAVDPTSGVDDVTVAQIRTQEVGITRRR